jgi:endonuclease-3
VIALATNRSEMHQLMKITRSERARIRRIVDGLAKLYPDAHCELDFKNPLQLLIATILSAQCTDVRVNQVTPKLFARYPDAKALAGAKQEELEEIIRSTGFYHAKARNIQLCCKQIVEQHGGKVPSTMEELVTLNGVGRKTANVILGNAFDTPGLPVDTHVSRLSLRLGLTSETDPLKIERAVTALVPPEEWTMLGHRLIFHGRRVCFARSPRCDLCTLSKDCPKIGVKKK